MLLAEGDSDTIRVSYPPPQRKTMPPQSQCDLESAQFHIPFPIIPPSEQFPGSAQLASWLKDWCTSCGLVGTEDEWHKVEQWRIPEFTALTHPGCRDEMSARLICAWVTWTSIVDDEFDAPTLSRPRPRTGRTEAAVRLPRCRTTWRGER
ncbi:hypothetical protein [Streptomyces boncukensis]|uniref:Uncharacterized protein n=1 Tax=Streptomyces boncukensis TaxID=2711219 RepID=A0A6G4WT92_9ACTN|nr:hypothetical protein [Streptomyces boncukensis]NGO68328.1 hypothetical protein [Streptomyces boncukensis]